MHFISFLFYFLAKSFADQSIVLGKEAKESQVPSDIAEKIDQIRSCTRIHAEISDNDSNVIPESCYDPVEAELKFAALEKTQESTRMAKRDRTTQMNLLKGTCSTPCEKRDLFARVKKLEHFLNGWRPLTGHDDDLINIGECIGNCHSSSNFNYRIMYHNLHGNGNKIQGCTILETESMEVIRGGYVANFPGVVIKSCMCNDIQYCQ